MVRTLEGKNPDKFFIFSNTLSFKRYLIYDGSYGNIIALISVEPNRAIINGFSDSNSLMIRCEFVLVSDI
jgi:hypothetical protein